ncbi:MAG: MopE-related protein [Solirubrobacterales bacterium]
MFAPFRAAAILVLTFLLLASAAHAAKPKLSIADGTAAEGDAIAFVVKLSKNAPAKVTAAYSVKPGSASAGDIATAGGKVKIMPGKRKAMISVASTEDVAVEPDETFTVKLTKPKGATIDRGTAAGTVENDDQQPPCTDGDSDGVCVEDSPPDCNDTEATISPLLTEIAANFIDDDCDLNTPDGNDTSDQDSDGYTVLQYDCNDTKSFIHPNAAELANRIDDDCDGLVDEGN